MRSNALIVEFFYLPEPLPLVSQFFFDIEEVKKFSRTCQLNLMAGQIHALQGAPLPNINQLPADPNWKLPHIIID